MARTTIAMIQRASCPPPTITSTGRQGTFYLVASTADFNHDFLGTTKTNEKPCPVTPCYTPDEETLGAQPRSQISALHKKAQ